MKRILNKTIFLGLALILITTGGCKKDWFDINTNPNDPVEANLNPSNILPGVITTTASNVGTGYLFLQKWLGVFEVQSGIAPSAAEESYNFTQSFSNGAFSTPYSINYNIYFMQKKAEVLKWGFYTGIAKILKSLNFARVVDVYSDVPYFETLKGVEFITPKYDNGQAIYEDLIKQIDEGMADIKATTLADNLNITTADVMFKGDKTKWLKFANTLKLRLLIHQANKPGREAYIAAEIAKIKAEGSGFLLTGQGQEVNPGYAQAQASPFYSTYGFTSTGSEANTSNRANNIFVEFLKTSGGTGGQDPRLTLYFKPIVNATGANLYTGGVSPEPFPITPPYTIRGGHYGLLIANAVYPFQTGAYLSKVGGLATTAAGGQTTPGMIKGWAMNSWIITSIESFFLQAEAIQRGWDIGQAATYTAEQAYKDAVLESFKYLYGDAATATTAFNTWYTAETTGGNKNVSYTAASDKLKVIYFQKYMALCMIDALETWTDYRRNGAYPVIPLSLNTGRTSSVIPIRLLYTTSETTYNSANTPQAGRASGEQFTLKIWWMP